MAVSGNDFYRRRGKRVLDLSLATPALVVSLPLQALVALVVRWRLGSPVLFRQRRPGRGEEMFTLFKFRTMTDALDEHGRPLPDDQRLTQLGQLLRATSIDELPELWNVVRGDMSLVGPRPLLEKYLPLYTSRQQRRHEVRPGLTGLAQVHGRNALGWHDRLEFDVEYVEELSLGLDLRIILQTVLAVLRRSGIAEEGQATMTQFAGE